MGLAVRDRVEILALWLLASVGVLLALVSFLVAALIAPRSSYVWNLLVSFDQTTNTLFRGDPDETISSRIAKKRQVCHWCRALCWLLDSINANHCSRSIEGDRGARQ